MGHPPFGHVGEQALDEAARRYLPDGFEGNAQSFRIITKIALRNTRYPGLNLSRATLDAVLKYPWFRSKPRTPHSRKWSAYRTEADEFLFARCGWERNDDRKSAEAEIMDWADDIAYSVHDVEDFYRMGLIPLGALSRDTNVVGERREFFNRVQSRHVEKRIDVGFSQKQLEFAANKAMDLMPEAEYEISLGARAALRSFTSDRIAEYVAAFSLRAPTPTNGAFVKIEPQAKKEVTMLKELTWNYVIHNPALATQQVGFKRIVTTLFDRLFSAASKKKDLNVFPPLYRDALTVVLVERQGKKALNAAIARIILDVVSSMTERQALRMYGRLEGTDPGSILDPLYY